MICILDLLVRRLQMSSQSEIEIDNSVEVHEKKKSRCLQLIIILIIKDFFLEDKLKKKKRKLENGNEIPTINKKKAKKRKLEQQNEEVNSDEELSSTEIDANNGNIAKEDKIETTGK